MNQDPPVEGETFSQKQIELLNAQVTYNREAAETNRLAIMANESAVKKQLAETPEGLQNLLKLQALQTEQAEVESRNAIKMQSLVRKFSESQMKNLEDTFDILFRQARGAAFMFYVSFWLGVALITASVVGYFVMRNGDNFLTIAFFGAGAITLLSFFLRDPADKVQQTAAKLVQIQTAMKGHQMMVGFWELFSQQKMQMQSPLTLEEVERAGISLNAGTQSILRQLDRSIDDKK